MAKIVTISSEVDLKKEALRSFQYDLKVDQKSFYFDEGANMYYTDKQNKINERIANLILNFGKDSLLKKHIKKQQRIDFISLGCGDGGIEKPFVSFLDDSGFGVKYYGVDSSMAMIERVSKNFSKVKFESQFIYADFSSEKFKYEYQDVIDTKSKKIFAFLGGTIGNVPQQYIANTLRNILTKGDILWIDTQVQKDLTNSVANDYFKKYLGILKTRAELFQYPLIKDRIPIEKGKMTLEMSRDDSVNTLIFKYMFQIQEKFEYKKNKETFTFLKGDLVDLITIRVYELQSLINFFEDRDFKLIAHMADNDRYQIAFEKL